MSPEDRTIYEKPGHLIRRLQQIAVALFVVETKSFGLTPVQYATLLAVDLNPGIDQTALANIIAFDRSTLADVVARLVAKRYIKQLRGEVDARTKVLHLTPQGARLLQKINPVVEGVQQKILSPLSPSERTTFMRMLARLVDINNDHSRAPRRSREARGRR
jgi:DNA-binding MarR family transcriptional regulator